MNRNGIGVAMVVAALASGAAVAQTAAAVAKTEEGVGAAQLTKIRVTVTALDVAKRELTVKHEDGTTETLTVGDAVKRLNEVKVGDIVDLEAYESLTLALDKSAEAAPAAVAGSVEARTEPSELPGGVKVNKVVISAKVTAIDAKTNHVTLTGPKGNSVVLEVDPDRIAKLQVGDVVEAVYTQALAVAVSRVQN